MATMTVKSTRKDGRVAFYEQDAAHPGGQVFVRGDQKPVEVGDTRALRKAIREGKVVEVAGVAPAQVQTPHTPNGGGQKLPPPFGVEPPHSAALTAQGSGSTPKPWEGYDALKVEDVVVRLPELDDAGRATVLAYEQSKGARARKSIIDALAQAG